MKGSTLAWIIMLLALLFSCCCLTALEPFRGGRGGGGRRGGGGGRGGGGRTWRWWWTTWRWRTAWGWRSDVGGEAAVVEVICIVFAAAIDGDHSVGVVGGGVLLGIQSGIILGQVIGRFLLHVKKVAHRMDVHFRATESMNAYGRLIVMVVNYMCCIISTRTSWVSRAVLSDFE